MNTMKNKYIIRSRISEKQFRKILLYFSDDLEATKIAKYTNISRKSINKILKRIRILMLEECEKISQMQGEVEVDESYFGPKRIHGKRGRGAFKKTPVFGMLKRNGYIHTQIVKDCSADELMPIIKDLSNLPKTEYYSDYWGAYDGLVDYGAKALIIELNILRMNYLL